MFRHDPGPCSVCGQAHTSCTAETGPIMSVMAPARDALIADQVQAGLQPGQFTTGTYRGKPGAKRRA